MQSLCCNLTVMKYIMQTVRRTHTVGKWPNLHQTFSRRNKTRGGSLLLPFSVFIGSHTISVRLYLQVRLQVLADLSGRIKKHELRSVACIYIIDTLNQVRLQVPEDSSWAHQKFTRHDLLAMLI
ncbi:hypothetical protein BDR07DRAFT_872207 [Suillus spraguei]|nr:hypothetical protein BDR07DRAFT_872207 [Suillus spraguei]